MELRRAGDALLRSQASPLGALLSPAVSLRWTNNTQLGYTNSSSQVKRGFSSAIPKQAIKRTATTSAPPPASEARTPESPQPSLDNRAQSLWTVTNASQLQHAKYGFGRPPPGDTLAPEKERSLNGGSSARDLLNVLNRERSRSHSIDLSRMSYPLPSGLLDRAVALDVMPKQSRVPMKLDPSTGRSIFVGSTGIDVATAFRLMEMSCARNKVKYDAMKQRFHERGGLKRKRLRRERWRTRFSEGFKATVARVKRLKHQGW
ncbi:unnamed protein product [Diplocarpon coronariae]|uniref:Ribosomal protein S21 n=1 Tax=Diplocarpon coronariae TaxID=2795749 RepID=A0A218YXT2_9HELO|nr:hypothetical protein JHW43_004082 [Diplocarpon mali]OWP00627.1 hypothetical protein B2J93_5403 [Marssonina coronariae]